MEDQLFNVGLKAFIELDGKLLVVRNRISSLWGLPGGRINEEETAQPFETTLLREIQEELGHELVIQIGSPFTAWKFILPNRTPILLVGFPCTLVRGNLQPSEEFDKVEWITEPELPHYSFLPGHAEVIQKWYSINKHEALR